MALCRWERKTRFAVLLYGINKTEPQNAYHAGRTTFGRSFCHIRRFLAGTMPNMENLHNLLGTLDSVEYSERTECNLSHLTSGATPIDGPNLRKIRQNGNMFHDLVTYA